MSVNNIGKLASGMYERSLQGFNGEDEEKGAGRALDVAQRTLLAVRAVAPLPSPIERSYEVWEGVPEEVEEILRELAQKEAPEKPLSTPLSSWQKLAANLKKDAKLIKSCELQWQKWMNASEADQQNSLASLAIEDLDVLSTLFKEILDELSENRSTSLELRRAKQEWKEKYQKQLALLQAEQNRPARQCEARLLELKEDREKYQKQLTLLQAEQNRPARQRGAKLIKLKEEYRFRDLQEEYQELQEEYDYDVANEDEVGLLWHWKDLYNKVHWLRKEFAEFSYEQPGHQQLTHDITERLRCKVKQRIEGYIEKTHVLAEHARNKAEWAALDSSVNKLEKDGYIAIFAENQEISELYFELTDLLAQKFETIPPRPKERAEPAKPEKKSVQFEDDKLTSSELVETSSKLAAQLSMLHRSPEELLSVDMNFLLRREDHVDRSLDSLEDVRDLLEECKNLLIQLSEPMSRRFLKIQKKLQEIYRYHIEVLEAEIKNRVESDDDFFSEV